MGRTATLAMKRDVELPPHSLDAERAVLGAALLDREIVPKAIELLRATDFYKEGHRHIFAAISALHERGAAADMLTVSEDLKRRGALDEAGGPAALAVLVEEALTVTSVTAASYIEILRELSTKRGLLALAKDLMAHALNGDRATDLIALAEQRLEPLRQRGIERQPQAVPLEAHALLARDFAQPPSVVADGVLPCGGLLVLGGPPKRGKSLAALNLALARATGGRWFGFPTTPGRTLLVQAEITPPALQERLRAMLSGLASALPPQHLFLETTRSLRVDEPEGAARLRQMLETVRPDLLVLDPLSRFMVGDENSTRDMSRVVAALDALVEAFGVAILIIHHVKKPSDGDHPGGERLRGSSALFGGVDSVLLLDRDGPRLRLTMELRHGAALEPRLFEIDPSLWLRVAGPAGPPDELLQVAAIVEHLTMPWRSLVQAIQTDMRKSERTAQRLIDRARKAGLVAPDADDLYTATATYRHLACGGEQTPHDSRS